MQVSKFAGMNIRPATEADIPAIIALQRLSLGEALLPKSEGFWRWKHVANPFGASPVLVAEQDGQLIGLRAFLRWQWRWQGRVFQAIRAVDTGTHPDHQGKGIFKKLTLQQIDECQQQGVHFVYNTPNGQSMPGYLKMGWQLQGKMPMKLQLLRPAGMAWNKLFASKHYAGRTDDPTPAADWQQAPLSKLVLPADDLVSTHVSEAYLRWRYADCPLYRYTYLTDGHSYLLIGRMKYQGFFKEFRITDFFRLGQEKVNRAELGKQLRAYCRAQKASMLSMSGQQFSQYANDLGGLLGPIPVQKIGPNVTLRSLNAGHEMEKLLQAANWGYSLGDMELF